MARYEHLPIYRKAFKLTVAIENLAQWFSRHHKYGLGSRLQLRQREQRPKEQHELCPLCAGSCRTVEAGAFGRPEGAWMKTPSGTALFSREALNRAWLACRRRKRGNPGALAFELCLADELDELERELCEWTYRPRPSVRFATRRPKLREILAADFRDRVVHHLLVCALAPDWERVFIHERKKHELKARPNVSYVDDLVIVHENPEQLAAWRDRLEQFLEEKLRLEPNQARTKLAPVSCGIDFPGYVIHPTHRLVRKRVVGNLRAALPEIEKETFGRGKDGVVVVRPGARAHDRLVSVLSSYLAHFDRADAHRLTGSLWRRHRWLGCLVGRKGSKVIRRDRPRRVPGRLRRQHAWFDDRAAGGALYFEVGSHFELLGRQARDFGPLLRLQPIEHRPGFSNRAGFPQRHLKTCIRRALDHGYPVTVMRETSRPTAG